MVWVLEPLLCAESQMNRTTSQEMEHSAYAAFQISLHRSVVFMTRKFANNVALQLHKAIEMMHTVGCDGAMHDRLCLLLKIPYMIYVNRAQLGIN